MRWRIIKYKKESIMKLERNIYKKKSLKLCVERFERLSKIKKYF